MKIVTISKRSIMTIGLLIILASLLIPQTAMAKLPAGIDPNHPLEIALAPNQTGLKTGQLAAGQEAWFAVKVTDLYALSAEDSDDDDGRLPLDLTLFVTPVDGNKIHKIRMEIFPGSYASHWSVGHLYTDGLDDDDADYAAAVTPFGVGRAVDRVAEDHHYKTGEGDPLVGSLVWSGDVINNDTILVRILNDNGAPVDYWFFTDHIIDVEF
jgi:hypothetical protein